jgi:hypothetical protein
MFGWLHRGLWLPPRRFHPSTTLKSTIQVFLKKSEQNIVEEFLKFAELLVLVDRSGSVLGAAYTAERIVHT